MKKFYWIFSIVWSGGNRFWQGSLMPSGAPAPTMKTLSELDAALTALNHAAGAGGGED